MRQVADKNDQWMRLVPLYVFIYLLIIYYILRLVSDFLQTITSLYITDLITMKLESSPVHVFFDKSFTCIKIKYKFKGLLFIIEKHANDVWPLQ